MFQKKRNPLYKNRYLTERDLNSVRPMMESAFAGSMGAYQGNPNREKIGRELMNYQVAAYANKKRRGEAMGSHALFEDAAIFRGVGGNQLTPMFESYSQPENIIGMGNVTNPGNMHDYDGGLWNPEYKTGSGDAPTYVFGLQSQIALYCIGFDLMPLIPVETPKVPITFIDTVYGGGSLDDANSHPTFLDFMTGLLKKDFITAKDLKRAKSKMYFVSSDKSAIEVMFFFGSVIRAGLTIEVLSTGEFDAGAYTEKNEVSVKTIIEKINSDYANAKIFVDAEGDGTMDAGTALDAPLSVNHTSATRTNVGEASSNDNSVGGMYRKQHRKGPKHKLNLVAWDKNYEMVGIEIEADTDNIQIKDFAAMGENVISRLYAGIQNQIIQDIDDVILDHLYRMGVTAALGAWEAQGIQHSLYIDTPNVADKDMTDFGTKLYDMMGEDVTARFGKVNNVIKMAGAENAMTYAERMFTRLLLIAEFIGYQNRTAPADFLVASGTLCAAIKKHSKFIINPVSSTISSEPMLAYSGTIFDSISVYNNPKIAFNDPRVLMGRRGDDTDGGSKFLAYDLAATRQVVAEDTMAEKIRIWSRFQIADVGFYPELNYYVAMFVCSGGWA